MSCIIRAAGELRSTCPAGHTGDNGSQHIRKAEFDMTAIDFSAFVDELAVVSAETILPFFRTAMSVHDKGRAGSFDPVTAADHAAETAMRALIRKTFPEHGIVGEEFGEERPDAD